MGLVTVIIAGATMVIAASLAYGIKKYQEVKQKNEEILSATISLCIENKALQESLNAYAETYSLENPDRELAIRLKNKIYELFGDGVKREFEKRKTLQEKQIFAQYVIRELINSIGVKVDFIEFDYENMDGAFGETKIDANNNVIVTLNEVLLVDDPVQLLKTACHELKHCVQIQSLTNNVWGYSSKRIAEYLYSWEHYVSPSSIECAEAYEKQIIEIDANKFVDIIFY